MFLVCLFSYTHILHAHLAAQTHAHVRSPNSYPYVHHTDVGVTRRIRARHISRAVADGRRVSKHARCGRDLSSSQYVSLAQGLPKNRHLHRSGIFGARVGPRALEAPSARAHASSAVEVAPGCRCHCHGPACAQSCGTYLLRHVSSLPTHGQITDTP